MAGAVVCGGIYDCLRASRAWRAGNGWFVYPLQRRSESGWWGIGHHIWIADDWPDQNSGSDAGISIAGPEFGLLGLAFAFGWTPCIGPVLGSILTVSALSAGSGAVLLAAYGLGLGVPFLLAAVLFANMAAALKRLRYAGHILNVAAGGAMIIMGLLMMTGQLQLIAYWRLERFPGLGSIG